MWADNDHADGGVMPSTAGAASHSKVYDLADKYVERYSRLDPVGATFRGYPGHDSEMTDYSPAGIAAREELDRQTIAALQGLPRDSLAERIAADMMAERLQIAQDQYEIGERLRDLRVIASPMQHIRQRFDLMPTDARAGWEIIATRLNKVPMALTSLQATLREAMKTKRSGRSRAGAGAAAIRARLPSFRT